jgi:hypothetical protein
VHKSHTLRPGRAADPTRQADGKVGQLLHPETTDQRRHQQVLVVDSYWDALHSRNTCLTGSRFPRLGELNTVIFPLSRLFRGEASKRYPVGEPRQRLVVRGHPGQRAAGSILD